MFNLKSSEARLAGRVAFLASLLRLDCPHAVETPEGQDWLLGWTESAQQFLAQ